MSKDAPDNQVPVDPVTILPDTVLDNIAEQLGLKPFSEDTRKELHSAVKRYTFDQKVFGAYEPELKSAAADYEPLKEKVAQLRTLLEQPEYSELAFDLNMAALHRNEPVPQTDFPEITDIEKTNGMPYLLELKRLLSLLEDATDNALERLSVPKGRKRNYPLEGLVRRLAEIWINCLGQEFKLDHHKGSGTTAAFVFVRLVVEKIIPDIEDTPIVTAMRTIKKELNGKLPNPSQK